MKILPSKCPDFGGPEVLHYTIRAGVRQSARLHEINPISGIITLGNPLRLRFFSAAGSQIEAYIQEGSLSSP